MIRFVYPNVNVSDQFIGCGRYVTTTPDDPCLTDGYTIADPNVGHLSKVTTAASLLAKESFDTDHEVYESHDDPENDGKGNLGYLGPEIDFPAAVHAEKNRKENDHEDIIEG